MPTTLTRTVKAAGGDYTTLSAAEAGEQGNLVTLDRLLVIECYNFQDTTAVVIDGSSTDATRYIRVVAIDRHLGTWSTSAYRLEAASSGNALLVSDNFTRIENLQIKGNASPCRAISIETSTTNVLIDSCLLTSAGASLNANNNAGVLPLNNATVTVRNCVAFNIRGCAFGAPLAGAVLTVQNSTSGGCNYGMYRGSGTASATNVYVGNAATSYFDAGVTITTCAHSSATVIAGSTANVAHSTANFVNVTAGSEDYHLVSGASATLKTGGTDLSGSFTHDIDGTTRSVWGIGADAEAPTGPAGKPQYYYQQAG